MKQHQLLLLALALTVLGACQSPTKSDKKETSPTEELPKYSGIKIEHTFDPLPYSFDALEPYIDAQTMQIHYDRHHRGYYNNFINAIKDTELQNASLDFIFDNMSKLSSTIRNNGGGYYNHVLFWEIMAADELGEPSEILIKAIEESFGSLESLKEEFNKMALTQFGSGWAWLIVSEDGSLAVTQTANQDNPLMDVVSKRGIPILALDVWEHAYYLKYQNLRAEYVKNFWNIVNWTKVNELYLNALNK
jgi:superoxide dismutase, Fe-Mn family